MPYATVNGRKAFYYCPNSPAGREVRGKTVILIHGAGANYRTWLPQIEFLANEHTLIGVDLPGHGDSEGPSSTNMAEYRDFIKGLVDTLDLTNLIIVGHSMGGSVALDYALRYPEVQGLILVGSGARWNLPKEYVKQARINPQKSREESAKHNFAKNTPRSVIELHLSNSAKTGPTARADDLEAANAWDVVAELDRIKVPTCIISGEEDPQAEKSSLMHSLIPGSTLEWIKDAGHFPTLEQPEITNRLFQSFLNSLA